MLIMDYVAKTINQELEYLRLSTTGNKSLVYLDLEEKMHKISCSLNYHIATLMAVSKMFGFEQLHLTRVQKNYVNIQGVKTKLVEFILAHINAIAILYYGHQYDLFKEFEVYKDKCDKIFSDKIEVNLTKEELEEFIEKEYKIVRELAEDTIDFNGKLKMLINSFDELLEFSSKIFIRSNLFNAINMIQTCAIQDLEQVKKYNH
ncbi:hypothetical protein ADU90_12150 [Clostridium botulinum]|uniref:Uncharacterized protein n=2 Tax=Clostridium botulinum TaxID=1491 RepID=A0A0A0IGZ2_CLOBO|nr:hypothetical protein Z956_07840 [Clostridium botulinum D str. CCUG 7971]KGN00218.1 hypothetical protein Z955_04270 [Clostridium botulinum C/D str. DC5]KOC50611.1 hypothetical protein ADU88_01660 [Clostridium botulinum]MCD3233497.1 hypothetical protein [Clostridium botulinum D/C]KOC51693.1 hypothetical protein ADU89_12875 [Clostridium botulinum]